MTRLSLRPSLRRRRAWGWGFGLLALTLPLAVPPVRAQSDVGPALASPGSAFDVSAARSLLVRGDAALAAGNTAEARRLYDQARDASRKLTGFYRISRTPGYPDVPAMIRALVGTRVDRLVWGSDDPHISFAAETGSISLYDLFCSAVDDDADLRTILVDTPARLYGFAPTGASR